jgi:putative transposase
MERKKYATDLSGDEWGCITSYLPVSTGRGRPRIHSPREILDALFYVLKTGCPWRLLPKDFPPWKSVCDWFRKWRIDGTFERLNATLCELLRARLGRASLPSVGVADSQTTKTAGVGGEARGYDGNKKVRGTLSATCWWTRSVCS